MSPRFRRNVYRLCAYIGGWDPKHITQDGDILSSAASWPVEYPVTPQPRMAEWVERMRAGMGIVRQGGGAVRAQVVSP